MKDFIKIYLAGACKNVKDEGKAWRNEIKKAFYIIAKYDNLYSCVIDPTEYFSYSNPTHKTDKQVKSFYMSQIRKCDILLVNLNQSEDSCGTCMEVQYAVDNHIPVIGFGNDHVYAWLKVDCDVIFDKIEEAIDYIKKYYMKSAQPIRISTL